MASYHPEKIKGVDYREYRREADRRYRERRKARDEGKAERKRKFTGQTMAEKVDSDIRAKMVEYRELGLSMNKIAKQFDVSRYVVERALALEELKRLKEEEA